MTTNLCSKTNSPVLVGGGTAPARHCGAVTVGEKAGAGQVGRHHSGSRGQRPGQSEQGQVIRELVVVEALVDMHLGHRVGRPLGLRHWTNSHLVVRRRYFLLFVNMFKEYIGRRRQYKNLWVLQSPTLRRVCSAAFYCTQFCTFFGFFTTLGRLQVESGKGWVFKRIAAYFFYRETVKMRNFSDCLL